MQNFSTIHEALCSHAKTIPDKIAIIEAETERKCSYGELWTKIKNFTQKLVDAGVKQDAGDGYGTRVVIRCAQAINYVISILAVQLAGGVFVPVEKNIAEDRIKEIMEEVDSNILIAVKPLSGYDYTYFPLYTASEDNGDIDDVTIIFPKPESLAIILYTTGTTGRSKGVMHTHKSFSTYFLNIFSKIDHDSEQTWLIPSPLSHTNGLNRILISLYNKCTAVLLDGYAFPKLFFQAVIKYNVTILNFIASTSEYYLKSCEKNFKEISEKINYILLGTSSINRDQIAAFRELFPGCKKIIQTYGGTEIIGYYIDHKKNINTLKSFCVGIPFEDTKIAFFDENKENIINATMENPGLFAMSNNSMMKGYWKNPELTKSVTRGDFIVLSDLGYEGEDGLYYFLSRADDIIISGGYKIAPLEIEEIANCFKGIKESVCIPVKDPLMGHVPKLYVVMEENYVFKKMEISRYLQSRLEMTRVPRYIEEIKEIPKINNKINRKELREL